MCFTNGYCEILHCEAQLEYLEWKRNFLIKNGFSCSNIEFKDNSGYKSFRFGIRGSDYSKLLRRILYKDNTKNYFSRKILDKLSAIHLAIWYMDDGGLSKKKRNGKIHANELMLNTHTSMENNQILIDYFKDKWDVHFNQYKNKGLFRLACGTKEARKFIKIVKPFIKDIECMKHKIDIKPERME